VTPLADLRAGVRVRGVLPNQVVTIKAVTPYGEHSVEVVFADVAGRLDSHLLTRDDEPNLELVDAGRRWSFDGDGELLRLVSEAKRLHLAWLFDPYLAVSTSVIDPLPHQISAVYEEMLPRQPMRFLLADDPGAGKTIMAGLLMKELMVRGELARCLIVVPGSLCEQWQDELFEKFGITLSILTRDMIEASRTANPFENHDLMIARLDQLSRNVDVQQRFLAAPEWDLIVCDEAHKMSAHYLGTEVKETKRYKLGKTLGQHCRNFLLMTATPHNGKEEDFQLFMGLLDGDRFEGRVRSGTHVSDASDMMRRLVKEDLTWFDGRRLFPERRAYAAQYSLSELEAQLYQRVTAYVREEMNRADRIPDAEGRRRNNVGFALQTLQRRLASSPESIYKSIKRRVERLEQRLRDERLRARGQAAARLQLELQLVDLDPDDLDEATQEEVDAIEEIVLDHATAAQTLGELEVEIAVLEDLAKLAKRVRYSDSNDDSKWRQLSSILDDPLMRRADGSRRKLVLFTEFVDTLTYLAGKIRNKLGSPDAVVEIYGQVARQDRRDRVAAFMNNPDVLVLIANDAAGEGVNLQRAHLMVNYDLPWNPNRLEQRFGRIHRIGQQEVCHLWNLIAKDTREGDVYLRLMDKLEAEREALGGKVYDVLGQLFEEEPLRNLLMDAIRHNNDPAVLAKLDERLATAMDRDHIRELLDRRALVHAHMDMSRVQAIREQMERAHARRLQPHFVRSFFMDAFDRLGGKIHLRESGRYEVTHVPQVIRDRDRQIGKGVAVQRKYERICFEKDHVAASPRAELVCPGHALLDCTIDLVIEQHRELLGRGAVLVDERDDGVEPRLLFFLEHRVIDGRRTRDGRLQVISQRLAFVEVDEHGRFRAAGAAPYLDYRPARPAEREQLRPTLEAAWLRQDWDHRALDFAIGHQVPEHVGEVKQRRLAMLDKVEAEVNARMTKEIRHWDSMAQKYKDQERAGKKTRLPASVAESRANILQERLKRRLAELKLERSITSEPPQLVGGALIVPAGLLRSLHAEGPIERALVDAAARRRVELLAMDAVAQAERALGRLPRDVSAERGIGYDIESRDLEGALVFIEVKGIGASEQVCLTRNEILCALNEPEKFRLAIVVVEDDQVRPPVYVRGFDFGQPGFEMTSSTYPLATLLAAGGSPT
jgi:superfamily II DNA or RNA helicase